MLSADENEDFFRSTLSFSVGVQIIFFFQNKFWTGKYLMTNQLTYINNPLEIQDRRCLFSSNKSITFYHVLIAEIVNIPKGAKFQIRHYLSSISG